MGLSAPALRSPRAAQPPSADKNQNPIDIILEFLVQSAQNGRCLPVILSEGETSSAEVGVTADSELLELKPALGYVYPVFILVNLIIFVIGLVANCYLVIKIVSSPETRSSRVLHFLANAAISDLFKLLFVLPITLAVLLLQNFVFGSFLCYAIPMLQVFPIHVSIITYFGLTYDRYSGIRYPDRRRSPALVHSAASWLIALLSVLPYASFITYIDLEARLGPVCRNRGLCVITLEKVGEDFLRATFFLIFFLPAAVMIYLLMRTSWELSYLRKSTRPTCTCDATECIMREVSWLEYDPAVASNSLIMESDSTRSSFKKKDNIFNRTFSLNSNHSVVTSSYRLAQTKQSSPVEENVRNYDRRKSTNSETLSMIGVDCSFCCAELQHKEQNRVSLIITLFIAAWTPINVFLLMLRFFSDSDGSTLLSVINLILTAIGFSSTCWNPFITYPMIRRRMAMQMGCSVRHRKKKHHSARTAVSAQNSLLSGDTFRKSGKSPVPQDDDDDAEVYRGKDNSGSPKRSTGPLEPNGNLTEASRPYRTLTKSRSRSPVSSMSNLQLDVDRETVAKERTTQGGSSGNRRPGTLSPTPAGLDRQYSQSGNRREAPRNADTIVNTNRVNDQQRITQARHQFAAQRSHSPVYQGNRPVAPRAASAGRTSRSFRSEMDA